MENKKTENINKPLILVRQECFNSLINIINESTLPAFIIEPMLKDLLNTIQHNMREEYEQTLNWYMNQLQKQTEDTNEVSDEKDLISESVCEDIGFIEAE